MPPACLTRSLKRARTFLRAGSSQNENSQAAFLDCSGNVGCDLLILHCVEWDCDQMTFTIGGLIKHHDPEFKQRIYELWNEGHSAGDICRILGGVTRNTVIGLVARAKKKGLIKQRAADITVNRVYKPRPKKLIAMPVLPMPVAKQMVIDSMLKLVEKEPHQEEPIVLEPIFETPETPDVTITIEQLSPDMSQCRWIFEENAPYTYCGKKVKAGSSWCEEHRRKVFQPFSKPGEYRRRKS